MALARSGELARRVKQIQSLASPCRLCPRQCQVKRNEGQTGYCRGGWNARVASYNAHRGEEPPISGSRGSGTVFFSFCTMRCVFCQNFPISQMGNGNDVTDEELAEQFLKLQQMGCHNLNLVTPTHFLHAFVSALGIAVEQGFRLPIVYNTSGFESLEALKLLDGIVDVYMPDMKYIDPEKAQRYSDAPDYVEHDLAAVQEMFRQVGNLQIDDDGLARRGLLVRHLVIPGAEMESIEVLRTLRDKVSPTAFVSLMNQYFPAHRAVEMPPLDRTVDLDAYEKVANWMANTDLQGWIQEGPRKPV